jgi:TonB family protein
MSSTSASCERHLEAGRRALSLGDLGTAESEFAAAVADAERPDADAEHLAASLATQAQLLYQAKRYAEAAPLFRRALEVRERREGADAPSLVPVLHNVAAVHLAMGDSAAAEPLLRRALSILERVHGEEHVELAGVLNGLSQLCLKRGAYAEAEPLLRRLLAIRRAQGEDRPEVATVMASLASVHHALAEHEAAEQLQRRVLEIRERTLAPNHYAIATTLEALAETCATRGKLEEAMALLERSLDMRDRTLGAAHPSLSVVRAKIADLQLQLSQDSFAVPLMEVIAEPIADSRRRDAPTAGSPPRWTGPLTDFHPRSATTDETFPGVAQPAAEPLEAIRRLAAELNGTGAGASDAPFADRSSESSLAVSILPTGGALVLPGSDRSYPQSAGQESAWEDEFGDEPRRPSRTSILARPPVRVAIGAAALVLVVVSTTLALWSGSGSEDFAPSGAGLSAPDGQGQQALSGSVALPSATMPGDSVDTTAERADAEPETSAVRGGTTNAASQRRADARNAQGSTRSTEAGRSSSGASRQESDPALTPLALPSATRLSGDLQLAVDAAVPTIEIGSGRGDPRPVMPVPGSRESVLGANAYSGTRGYRPAAHIGQLPTPIYPNSLRQLGIRGEVVVSFTVDTNGRVDANTFRVVRATDMRFVASVSELLPDLRFMPAEAGGRPVTQTIQIPFRFEP